MRQSISPEVPEGGTQVRRIGTVHPPSPVGLGDVTIPTERLTVNGVELAWGRWGRGHETALVLCHGFTGSSHDFALHIETLSWNHQVIAIDQRGHGLSSKSRDASRYSGQLNISDLIAFLDQVVGHPVHLLGHSAGGPLVLSVALARPDLVHSLVLMDTSAWGLEDEDESLREVVAEFIKESTHRRGSRTCPRLVVPSET